MNFRGASAVPRSLAMRHEFGDSDGEYESVLLVIKECFVYRIPPRTKSVRLPVTK